MTTFRPKTNVLLISNLFSIDDAYGAVCTELASNLSTSGWRVKTTSASKSRIIRPLDMAVTIWSNRQNYSVAQVDVFSGAAFRWAESSIFLLDHLKKPFILTLHGGNLPSFSAAHQKRVTTVLNKAAVVTTPSRYLLEAMHPYRADIRLLPNPIDIRHYPFRLRSKVVLRILYLRALHKVYNPLLAVQVTNILRELHPEVSLSMAGPDKGDGSLEVVRSAIRKARLANHVNIIGTVPKTNVPVVMSQSDIFINTTNVDNTPISIIEAMACGLCIVSTNVGGIPYLLQHDHDALLVPPNDPQAMADAVSRVLQEPGLSERLSRNARAKAEQFDWSRILPQWESLLFNAIEQYQHG